MRFRSLPRHYPQLVSRTAWRSLSPPSPTLAADRRRSRKGRRSPIAIPGRQPLAVLETTGLANPYNLLDEIAEANELVRFDSITTLVDGLNVDKSLEDYQVAKDQIKAADILLLNKRDLLDEIQLKEIHQKIRWINPDALILSTKQGDINPSLIYGIDPQDILLPPLHLLRSQKPQRYA